MKPTLSQVLRAVLLTAALLGASAVQAAQVVIDLSSNLSTNPNNYFSGVLAGGTSTGGDYRSVTYSKDGVEVTAVAGYTADGATFIEGGGNNYPTLGWWQGNGLGVWSSQNDEHTVDNKGVLEYVKFEFDQDVLIQSVTISCLSCDLNPGWDAAFLLGDLGPAWTEISGGASTNGTYTFYLTGLITDPSNVFRFGASQIVTQVPDGFQWVAGTAENGAECQQWQTKKGKKTCVKYAKVKVPKYKTQYDDFKIQKVGLLVANEDGCFPGIDCEPEPCTGPDCEPNEAPLPSTLSMLGLGALAMAASRMRRRKGSAR